MKHSPGKNVVGMRQKINVKIGNNIKIKGVDTVFFILYHSLLFRASANFGAAIYNDVPILKQKMMEFFDISERGPAGSEMRPKQMVLFLQKRKNRFCDY